jgi:anaerobic magnesium-protoporphyrin IX monomethyl ester cyclase
MRSCTTCRPGGGAAHDLVQPDQLVITTAPSYLFWRCPPPELRVPQELLRALAGLPGVRIVVGPHASTTPAATLRKLGADVAVLGECEETSSCALAAGGQVWRTMRGAVVVRGVRVQGGRTRPATCGAARAPSGSEDLARHRHHHHRFDTEPVAPGRRDGGLARLPVPLHVLREGQLPDDYRKRPLPVILEELDGSSRRGSSTCISSTRSSCRTGPLLEALATRPVRFGVQTRIDLWTRPMLDLLGRAGCVSIEAGVESITAEGRNLLDKPSRLTTAQITERLMHARRTVPFVQANLLESGTDDPAEVEPGGSSCSGPASGRTSRCPCSRIRARPATRAAGAPLTTSPGSGRWSLPRARSVEFSDIQEARPRPLPELEHPHAMRISRK